jgi:hypothetical protein
VVQHCTATTSAGTASLDPEQAANAALIAAIGQARGMSPRAVTIALATALQESKLRNLDYGDRDSLGLFQQRPSQGWGTAEEVMDPIYSAGIFYRELAKVPGFEDMAITEAAQAVQRSAYPDAYAKHEPAARSFASSLTGNSPAALSCSFAPATSAGDPVQLIATLRSEWGDAIADAAQTSSTANSPDTAVKVTLTAATLTDAWALAAWSVAKGAELSITSVSVDGQVWQRDTAAWRSTDEVGNAPSQAQAGQAQASPSAGNSGSTALAGTPVVITLAV